MAKAKTAKPKTQSPPPAAAERCPYYTADGSQCANPSRRCRGHQLHPLARTLDDSLERWALREKCRRCGLHRYCEAEGDGYNGLCPECADATNVFEGQCGILEINWAKRTFTVRGAGGHNRDLMTAEQVMAELRKPVRKGVQLVPFIVWSENEQLALHDAESFAREYKFYADL
jgi:hypothetical protein